MIAEAYAENVKRQRDRYRDKVRLRGFAHGHHSSHSHILSL